MVKNRSIFFATNIIRIELGLSLHLEVSHFKPISRYIREKESIFKSSHYRSIKLRVRRIIMTFTMNFVRKVLLFIDTVHNVNMKISFITFEFRRQDFHYFLISREFSFGSKKDNNNKVIHYLIYHIPFVSFFRFVLHFLIHENS